jgi:hypothetical protein
MKRSKSNPSGKQGTPAPAPTSNGEGVPGPSDKQDIPQQDTPAATPPPAPADSNGEATLDPAGHLTRAVENPGVTITEDAAPASPGRPVEILGDTSGPGAEDSGQPLEQDPELMVVQLERPNPHAWVAIIPEARLRVLMLPHKSDRSGTPTLYWISPELRRAVAKELRPMLVQLMWDTASGGAAFLWAIPDSELSPYFNSLSAILAKGGDFLKSHLFRFSRAELGS